ncbi:hypothetical protein NIE88_07040 [Sporolactobacillus shoreicorticis]|uniref:DUF6944 family repetitive protein n=1 Tax=Sporolactobacillus shoreicorticis TaxID=1923877 RepID=A0ABW5S8P2_9BACL|nr:hypothetical protein [Sporolactobacillus shoreicorticis]MCO7125525.1 hypothetical protein [Sporolactobacillus shoreicorticis]
MGERAMNGQIQEAEYALINALGTIVAAVGATPNVTIPEQLKGELGIIGNALQAAGSALDANKSDGLDAIGDGTQAFGNSLVIYGAIAHGPEENGIRATLNGNWLQALGGSLSLHSNLVSEERNRSVALSVIGNLLQIAGNSLQGASSILRLNQTADETKSERIDTTGSWVQAIGAVLSFLAVLDQVGMDEDKLFKNPY